MRGKHKNRPYRYPQHLLDEVENHIKRFPVVESHYCRDGTQRKYLEKGLSIAKMHRMYVNEKQGNTDKTPSESKSKEEEENEEEDEEEEDEDEEDEEEYDAEESMEKDKENKRENKESKNEIDKEKNVIVTTKKVTDVIDENIVRLSKYTEIFNNKFNYGFYKPKKDQ